MKERSIITFALAVLTLAGCQRTSVEEPSGEFISFGTVLTGAEEATRGGAGVSTGSTAVTRAGAGTTLIDTKDELQAQAFGIYGLKSEDDKANFVNVFTSDAALKVYYTTTAIDGQADANTWTYDDRQKWERTKHYRFRAFWPYTANVNQKSTAKFLAIEYKSVEDYDLMVAYSTRYPLLEGIDRVPMQFHHALSGLRFKFKLKNTELTSSDAASSLYVTGLYLSGTLIYGKVNDDDNDNTLRWNISENNFDSTTHLFEWTGEEEFTDSKEATVFENDKVVFAIPQTLSSTKDGRNRKAYIHFATAYADKAVQTVEIPETTLEPGKIYTFTLIISDSTITVNVDVEDWTEIQSNVDIYF